ncbi:MAG: class 1 fructose-bisphosphatase [Alphaproteobacteria bacterium]|jgi:fructose-1,6-bisphosphatase I|nr:class 1 fructose-bisphosphatase [Alphaproteobacteria bacterium]MBT4967209.1 class 1 fructose-bisphosphatase [Alphaproteobacteria bacterium]MBT5159947.1 class 1 fructose-bisphosphatase [Alphaproteobacteria bacterium]MBT5917006.1 class 1 fructose-bisphosphatase [Alphaproteobacteria bacterium]MBT6385478.1 class 1 fructose-bisphosphatase [Alphaproteobacteria bacterium]
MRRIRDDAFLDKGIIDLPDLITLGNWLERQVACSGGADQHSKDVQQTIRAICEAGRILAGIIASGDMGSARETVLSTNEDGDVQKPLDIKANDLIIELLKEQPVAWLASEELAQIHEMNSNGTLAVAMDPLDGSSNVDTNLSLGTIFSIYDATLLGRDAVLQTGRQQLAAGYIVYGPQTTLTLTLGNGTHIFTLDRARRHFFLTSGNIQIPQETSEFAINASNFRFWDANVRNYVEDCMDGETGIRGRDFNMRWLASLVAECHRILSRGGIFLYPADARPGYGNGRLRLVYEANAIAWLIEQAGGSASTGTAPILDVQPKSIHERVSLVFGSSDEVELVENYCNGTVIAERQSPLFAKRGLFMH